MRRGWLFPLFVLIFVPRAARPQGEPLGPEFRVNTHTTGYQGGASVATDGAGNFVVVWSGAGATDSGGVFGQRYDSSGAPLGPEFRVNTYTTGGQSFPSVASDPVGNVVVVWSSFQDGSDTGVFGQRYASSGAPLGPEFRVNTYTTDHQSFPFVESDSVGDFVVVWTSYGQDGSGSGVFGQRYASSGAPLGPEFRVNTYTTNHQGASTGSPSVAADASGNFVVVWDGVVGNELFGVFGQRYASSGAPLGPEFRVNTYTTGIQGRPSVASDSVGNLVVTWYGVGGSDSLGVFGQRYASSGAPLGQEFRVNSHVPNVQWAPAVVSDSAGNFVVGWASDGQDGASWGSFGQRYASSGAPLGSEFRMNTYTTGDQGGLGGPSIAADTSGNFVVVWTSELQDGSSYGVFGQRFAQIVPVELMHFRVE